MDKFAFDMKNPYSYDFNSLGELKSKISSLGLYLPLSDDFSVLSKEVVIAGSDKKLKNSLTIHPMEGFDADPDGTPSGLSLRRYGRFANSGAALAWSEAISVVPEGRSNPRQFMLTEENAGKYAEIAETLHAAGMLAAAQLTHSGRFSKNDATQNPIIMERNPYMEKLRPLPEDMPCVSDDYLDRLPEIFAKRAKLAVEAGFDIIDVKCCHHYLFSEALAAFDRKGKYGGSYENRTRLFLDSVRAVKAEIGGRAIIGSRFGACDMIPYPYGFGMKTDGSLTPDYTEPLRLTGELMKAGVAVIDLTLGSPYFNPHVNRPHNMGGYIPPEHPLVGVERLLSASKLIHEAYPSLCLIGTGYSYLKEFSPYLAAGALKENYCSAVGFGRMAFAYEGFAKDMTAGRFDRSKSCITCGKCTEIMRAGGTTGCPIRDREVYLPIYRQLCKGRKFIT